jgi:hypothetical protein
MAKFRTIVMEVFMLALLAGASAVSLGQLTAPTAEAGCAGLECWAQEDCGPNCFCNRPSSTCFSNKEEEIQ